MKKYLPRWGRWHLPLILPLFLAACTTADTTISRAWPNRPWPAQPIPAPDLLNLLGLPVISLLWIFLFVYIMRMLDELMRHP